jgi:hypothetical protein
MSGQRMVLRIMLATTVTAAWFSGAMAMAWAWNDTPSTLVLSILLGAIGGIAGVCVDRGD